MITQKSMAEILTRSLAKAFLQREKSKGAALLTIRAAMLEIKHHSRLFNTKSPQLLTAEREIFALGFRLLDEIGPGEEI